MNTSKQITTSSSMNNAPEPSNPNLMASLDELYRNSKKNAYGNKCAESWLNTMREMKKRNKDEAVLM